MKTLFNKISQFGIEQEQDEFVKKKIILANKLSLVLSALFLLFAVLLSINFQFFTTSALLIVLALILISIPFLSKKKYTNFARVLLSIIFPIFIYVASIYVKLYYVIGKEIVFYFLPRTAILILAMVPLTVLDYRKKLQYYLPLAFYAFCILIYSKVHQMLDIGIDKAILTGNSYFLASILPALILAVLVVAYSSMQKLNYEYERSLKKKNSELEISEKKQRFAKEKAEESDRLKTEFLYNVSHEIRTPMNGILGFANMLDNPEITDKTRKQYIDIIQSNGTQLIQIIDDIIEISFLGTKQVKAVLSKVCLNDLLQELFSVFDKKAKENKTPLYLKIGLSDKKSRITTDKSKLRKVLTRLLENAIKFTSKGSIEFGYSLVKAQGTDFLSEEANCEFVELYVKDTGIGIVPEKQKIIFKQFSQEEKDLSRKVGGLGLGLSIAKENAKLLGGNITLKSEKEKGSTFFVSIPYKQVNFKAKIDKLNIVNKQNG